MHFCFLQIDYEKKGETWSRMTWCSSVWNNNLETIMQWSPYFNEVDLLQQVNLPFTFDDYR